MHEVMRLQRKWTRLTQPSGARSWSCSSGGESVRGPFDRISPVKGANGADVPEEGGGGRDADGASRVGLNGETRHEWAGGGLEAEDVGCEVAV